MIDTIQEEVHSGPVKNPKQLLITVFFSFVIPIFIIIGLVMFVVSANKPAAGAGDLAKAADARIQRVGTVEIRDANRPLKGGEEVFKAQCVTCHGAGVAGAPKFGDAGAWAARIKTGYDALLHSALAGKGAMAPQGGGDFDDVEIGRAVVYMANAAGATFPVPDRAAAPAAAADGAAPAAATAAPMAAAPVAPAAAATAAATVTTPAPVPVAATGEALYKQACQLCHAAGVAGAPKFGDKAAWAERLKDGIDGMTRIAIAGKGAMPPRGGTQASDAEIRAVVEYMAAAVK
ncbi:c-type cytochrome [Xylophilus ampelinus]|uniref:Cytochrome c5 n=1 Tax=Xylophilus ampelinus TaxID=54067 RepID=A0A318SE00_9BURK|nr:c-type cytochrome [Xylophilus ampelinus]MCS4511431.1 c-type cytochrome [Xylophilus ampelinus]PYE75826.1 cytochrome c5 [Xylophilus ampelinus]